MASLDFFPRPSTAPYVEGDGIGSDRITFTPSTRLTYGRSKRAWRTPRLHIVAGQTVNVYVAGLPDEEYVVWWCSGDNAAIRTDKAQVLTELPDGFEICQPCAERMAFARKRADEQQAPDRAAYNAETKRLIEAATR